MGIAQGHSPCCAVAALGLDPGLLAPSDLCTTTGGLPGEGGRLDHAPSLSFCVGPAPRLALASPPSSLSSALYFPHRCTYTLSTLALARLLS